MTDYSDFAEAAMAVVDPTTSPADLAQIAEQQPGLWAQVAGHPAAYPELLQWLDSVGDTSVKTAIAARHTAGPEYATPGDTTVMHPTPQMAQWANTGQWVGQPTQMMPPGSTQQMMMRPAVAQQPSFMSTKRGRITMITVSGVALLIVIALILTFTVWLPHRDVEGQFNNAVTSYQQAQSDLATQLTSAQAVAGAFTGDNLDDATTLDTLNSLIQTAQQSSTTPPPTMASSTDAIRQQITSMQTATQNMQGQAQDLDTAVQNVQASAMLWAKSALTTAIADANNTFSQYSYSNDQTALTNLRDEISSAQAVLNGIDQADMSTLVQTVSDTLDSLTGAQQAVIASAPVHCGDITLPSGVDSRACGSTPDGAISLPSVPEWGAMFEMPSHNIGCYPSDNGVTCEISSHKWTTPSALTKACKNSIPDPGMCDGSMIMLNADGSVGIGAHGDVPPWQAAKMENANVPLLAYGKVIDYYPVACLSAQDGVTCWNIYTHHGFKMSASAFTYW